jgi:hypothetical protein
MRVHPDYLRMVLQERKRGRRICVVASLFGGWLKVMP